MTNLQFLVSNNRMSGSKSYSKDKEIKKLTEKCKDEGLAKFLYNCGKDRSKIKWIPHEEFSNIKPLAEGGFGFIHTANWCCQEKVVLKSVYDSQNAIMIILKELKAHKKIHNGYKTNKFINECYGITKDETKNTYMIVLKYAEEGDLHNYLSKNFKNFFWKHKLKSLLNISIGLNQIHSKNFVHSDLHSRNILIDKDEKSIISDLGLCVPVGEDNKVYGVIPYLAPEVLYGKPYTKESDIYSFGMLMWVYTSGKEPFDDGSHNIGLVMKILEGKRPNITGDTPKFYSNLMKRCWDPDPKKRPTAKEIVNCLNKYNNKNNKIIELAESKRKQIIDSDDQQDKYKSNSTSYEYLCLNNKSMHDSTIYSLCITTFALAAGCVGLELNDKSKFKGSYL